MTNRQDSLSTHIENTLSHPLYAELKEILRRHEWEYAHISGSFALISKIIEALTARLAPPDAGVEAGCHIEQALAAYQCPCGIPGDARQYCSAGTCPECLRDHLATARQTIADNRHALDQLESENETYSRMLATALAERDHWKANHDEMVARNAVLRDRPDLPTERLQSYQKLVGDLGAARERIGELEKTLDKREALLVQQDLMGVNYTRSVLARTRRSDDA